MGGGVPQAPALIIQTTPGGYPIQSWWGVPHPVLARGIPHPVLAGGYPIQSWLGSTPGYPPRPGMWLNPHHPDLARGYIWVPPHPDLEWSTPLRSRPGMGYPLSRPGMGYSPPSRPEMGYPPTHPDLGWGTPTQTQDKVPPTQTRDRVPPQKLNRHTPVKT